MKVLPAFFLTRYPGLAVTIASLAFSSWVSAQPAAGSGLAAGAVQQPYYRHSGSAYVPPGTVVRPQTQPSRGGAQQAPSAPSGYQPGFGTPPAVRPGATYRPPSVKAPVAKPSSSKSGSLESKVARLEKNDAHQDRRLSSLEGGGGSVPAKQDVYAPTEGALYTVKPGDTLWRIASRNGTSVKSLKSANHLSGETIAVGQALMIPGKASGGASSSVTAPSSSGSHIVRPGDSFASVARRYGVSQDALARANPSAYADRLLVGEKLNIPGQQASPPPAATSGSGAAAAVASRSHVVKKGESLGAIARSYGVSTASVASANKLKNANLIAPGMKLRIPGTVPAKISTPAPAYPDADPDTTPMPEASLAAHREVPAVSSPASVSLPATTTAPAAPLPSLETKPVMAPATAPVSSNRRGIVAYRLERGDDIQTVAALFNTTPEKIRSMNNLSADKKLKEGDEVVVPSLGAVSLN